MITNLFSIFDPSTRIIKLNWIIIFLPIIIAIRTTIKSNKFKTIINLIKIYLRTEINAMITRKNKSSIIIISRIFFFIIWINMPSLISFNFTITSQISFNFPIAITIWMRFLILGWIKKTKNIIAHLLPTGTPKILIPIIIIIEIIRQIIRPITLSVRLTANIIAGHLLLSLLSNLSITRITIFVNSIPILMILSFLEICVSIIQAYVFITLLTLYSTEIN